jgi:hypothetical protein
VTIGDGLTQGTMVVSQALHSAIVVTHAEVALLEDTKPGAEMQNMLLTVAEELSLYRKPRLTCSLRRFLKDLMEFEGEGAEDPCHHDAIQCNPIEGWISDIR